jgi:hypothetical protein
MSGQTDSGTTTELRIWSKEVGRARVFAFLSVFVLAALGPLIMEESDIFLHALDDYIDVIAAVIVSVVLLMMWGKKSSNGLHMANNIGMLFSLVIIFAITQEINDPMDLWNEIPTLIWGILLLANRFT